MFNFSAVRPIKTTSSGVLQQAPRLSLGDSKCTMVVSLRGHFNCLNLSSIDNSFGLIETHPSETGGTTSKNKTTDCPRSRPFFCIFNSKIGSSPCGFAKYKATAGDKNVPTDDKNWKKFINFVVNSSQENPNSKQ